MLDGCYFSGIPPSAALLHSKDSVALPCRAAERLVVMVCVPQLASATDPFIAFRFDLFRIASRLVDDE